MYHFNFLFYCYFLAGFVYLPMDQDSLRMFFSPNLSESSNLVKKKKTCVIVNKVKQAT